jgi:hypothetical protein
MSRRRKTLAFVFLYTVAIVVTTSVLEHRARLACSPGDKSCDDLNATSQLIFYGFGFLAWVAGLFVIVLLRRRFAKPS